jgi:opine dehydrogenase
VCLTSPGPVSAFAPVALATTDMQLALACARLILVTVPASAHAEVARACAPYLRDGQTILLLPGRTGGALEFRRVLHTSGCRARILLGETNTFPFAARCIAPGAAAILGAKSELFAAALPATRTTELVNICRQALPMIIGTHSVLHTSLNNVGAILHPAIMLMNAGRIASAEAFHFYADGVTPAVAETLAAADAERLEVARAYGVRVPGLVEWIAANYGHHARTIQDAIGRNPAYANIKAPTTLEHRYLHEDVPTGLIPLAELGEAVGVAVPTMRDLTERCRELLGGASWWCRPRTLAALGLDAVEPDAIRSVVELGRVPASVRSIRLRHGDESEILLRSASA